MGKRGKGEGKCKPEVSKKCQTHSCRRKLLPQQWH
jgi:hypothetical protein